MKQYSYVNLTKNKNKYKNTFLRVVFLFLDMTSSFLGRLHYEVGYFKVFIIFEVVFSFEVVSNFEVTFIFEVIFNFKVVFIFKVVVMACDDFP